MALTTLDNVKSTLCIPSSNTDYDAVLQRLIDAVSDSIERYCNRQFSRANYASMQFGSESLRLPWDPNFYCENDWGGSGVNYPTIAQQGEDIVLSESPVHAVLYAAYGMQCVANIEYLGTQAGSMDVVAGDKDVLVENLTQTEIAFTDTMTIQDVIDLINAEANWSATSSIDQYASYPARAILKRYVGPEGENGTVGNIQLYAAVQPFRLTRQTDGLYRANVKVGSNTTILIIYDGGYEDADLPAGLVEVATKATADAFQALKRAAGLKGETIGDYKWEVFEDGSMFSYFGSYVEQLDLYRRIPMGVNC